MKNLGIALMILGLASMVVAYIQTDDIIYVLGGLLIVGIGGLINAYGQKQTNKK